MRHDEIAEQIDWAQFTPWDSLAGGILIGLASIAFALLLGRIAGISGIVDGLLRPQKEDLGWRVAFVAGQFAFIRWQLRALRYRSMRVCRCSW